MAQPSKTTFSLVTLFLVVLLAALVISQIVMMRQLADARAEVDDVRRKYGYIRVEDQEHVFVARIAENELGIDAYRIHVPPGHRYMLNLTDTTFPTSDYPVDPQPTKTVALNSWMEGADAVLTYSVSHEGNSRRVRVSSETELLFDYLMTDWVDSGEPKEGSHLQTNPQNAFTPNETIRFMWWRDPQTTRGLMLWMEPFAEWEARWNARRAMKQKSE